MDTAEEAAVRRRREEEGGGGGGQSAPTATGGAGEEASRSDNEIDLNFGPERDQNQTGCERESGQESPNWPQVVLPVDSPSRWDN